MNTTQRYCAVCQKPLPDTARKSRRFCSDTCSARVRKRRAKGKPIADPTATPEEIATLKLQLVQQQETIVQLQKEAAKLHNAKLQPQLQPLQPEISNLQPNKNSTHAICRLICTGFSSDPVH